MEHEIERFLEPYALRRREMLAEFRLKELLVNRLGELSVDV
jgi:hypothetical protein